MKDASEKKDMALSADWFLRGSLTRLGDNLDKFLSRTPRTPGELATSKLITRLKLLLDNESIFIEGKGLVAPHNITVKIEWDKFTTDEDDALDTLRADLLAAAADHINDSLYYTIAPLELQVNSDYFTEGVRIQVDFGELGEGGAEREISLPALVVKRAVSQPETSDTPPSMTLLVRIDPSGRNETRRVDLVSGRHLSIGRTGGNDLLIDDNSVSKYHASLSVTQDRELSVADTGSTNGTFINGQRISYGKACMFKPSDILKIGNVEMSFDLLDNVKEHADPSANADHSPAAVGSRSDTDLPDAKGSAEITSPNISSQRRPKISEDQKE